jgi:hypothetical protein
MNPVNVNPEDKRPRENEIVSDEEMDDVPASIPERGYRKTPKGI